MAAPDGSPEALSSALRSAGINPATAVQRRDVPPERIDLLEGYQAPADPARAREIAEEQGTAFDRVLLVRRDGRYETINGVHRVAAARLMGMDAVPALVVSEAVFDVLFHEYGEVAMARWAREVVGSARE